MMNDALLRKRKKEAEEVERLREREKRCPTMDEAEKRALLRAIQEIAYLVGLTIDHSPHDTVEAVRKLVER